jgi:glycine hydroxymethyltransferase
MVQRRPYGVDATIHLIDFDQVEALAKEHRPKLIIAGGSAYPRIIDFAASARSRTRSARFSWSTWRISPGLVAGGVHPTPFGHAHVVTTTTHKTLRGPARRHGA